MEGLWSFNSSSINNGKDKICISSSVVAFAKYSSTSQLGIIGMSSAVAACKKQGCYVRWSDAHFDGRQYIRPVPNLRVRCSGNDSGSEHVGEFDRRQVLLTLAASGVRALPGAGTQHAAFAAPVQPPNLEQCNSQAINGVDCCLPVSTVITDFKLPQQTYLRLRRPAHNATSEYITQYEKAYHLLRELPASDPRQFAQQANVHCAFCDSAYVENGTTIEYQVHNSWLFFPWHRWFLYFHERILASVLEDPNFALPFWNWDSASGNTLPPMYSPSSSPLYDAQRNPLHVEPAVVDLNYNLSESGLSAAAQLAANNTLMYRQFVSASTTPSLFFGQAYRQGGHANPGGGTVENIPHGTVHVWTGNPANAQDEDMGALYSAARDPIFFAHHANLDRLWGVWKSLGGRRKDITDPDWLNATFLFYDENAELVRVTIKDALDPRNLGYKYEDVPNAWVSAKPKRFKSRSGKKSNFNTTSTAAIASAYTSGVPFDSNSANRTKSAPKYLKEAFYSSTTMSTSNGVVYPKHTSTFGKATLYPNNTSTSCTTMSTNKEALYPHQTSTTMAIGGEAAMAASTSPTHHSSGQGHHSRAHGLKEFKERDSKHVEKALSVLVKRPKKVKADDYEEEILVFEGVEIPTDEKVKFDVYMNLTEEELEEEEGEIVGCDIAEYVGSFFNVPHLGKKEVEGKKIRKSDFKLAIGGVLKELGLEEEDSFVVTIIPRSRTSFPIFIQDVKLEYE